MGRAEVLHGHRSALLLRRPVQYQRLAVGREERSDLVEIDLGEILPLRDEALDLLMEEVDLAVETPVEGSSDLADLRQGDVVAEHLEDHPVLIAAPMASRWLADRKCLQSKATLIPWISLRGLAEPPVEPLVRLARHAMREAAFRPTGRSCRIVLWQILQTPVSFWDRSILPEPGRLVAGGAFEILLMHGTGNRATQDATRCRVGVCRALEGIGMHPKAGASGVAAEVQVQARKILRQVPLERRKSVEDIFEWSSIFFSPRE